MASATLKIDGQKFRLVPEAEYRALAAALRAQQRQENIDLADAAKATRKLNDPARKTIPVSKLRSRLEA